jgi:predicted deacylase
MGVVNRRRIVIESHEREGFEVVELGHGMDGPTVSVVGGIHGDEFEGVMACLRLAEVLAELPIRGRLRLVPVAHEVAHKASLRSSPLDGLNLARTFPGDSAGGPTERLADALRHHIIEGSDLFVDLHSAGTAYAMPLLVGWTDDGCVTCAASRRAAEAFAPPVLWRHPGAVPPGRTLSVAHAAGIPSIYAEAAGGGTLTEAHVEAYVTGIRRILTSFGMLDDDGSDVAALPPPPRRLVGEGNLDVPAMVAPFDGVCEMYVGPLDTVVPGQHVATVTDPATGVRGDVLSAVGGTVVLARRGARVGRMENLVVLAESDTSRPAYSDTARRT